MSKEKRRVPRLRFPGFTGDWEQRKFKDLFIERREKTIRENEETLLSCAITGIYLNSELFSHFRGSSTIGYLKIKKYDLILSAQNLHLGNANINLSFEKGMISPAYKVFELKNIDPYFINAWVKKDSTKNFFLKATTEGASQCRKNIEWDVLLNQEIPVPNNLEQRVIGKFINNIDMIITLHQRKLNHLILKKKSLLQKLFPKNGGRYPELRFPGFTDAWEQRKLGECMNSFAYGLNAAAKEYDGMHKYIRITDIDDETHNFIQSNLTSPDIDFNMDVSDYKLNVGDIVFARTGASVGKTYLYNPNDGDLYYAGFLIRGKVKEDCDAGFIYQNTLTKDYDSFIKITSQRSGQPGVNSKEYATFRLNIPCKDEQEKISKVLISLDELFTLHQRKLDHLQLQKKALLQQMFV